MSPFSKRSLVLLPLVLAGISFVKAPSAEPSQLSALADVRYQAAVKQFDETWLYYKQDRIDSYQVYVWSRIMLDCRRETARTPAERVAAIDEHLGRMKELESLVKKVRRLGFGRSYDVGASGYYRAEAEYWLTREKASKS
jgi:hypothetical protein